MVTSTAPTEQRPAVNLDLMPARGQGGAFEQNVSTQPASTALTNASAAMPKANTRTNHPVSEESIAVQKALFKPGRAVMSWVRPPTANDTESVVERSDQIQYSASEKVPSQDGHEPSVSKKGSPTEEMTESVDATVSRVVSPNEGESLMPVDSTNHEDQRASSHCAEAKQSVIPVSKKREAQTIVTSSKRARPTTQNERRATDTSTITGVGSGTANRSVTDEERAATEDFLRRLQNVVWKWQAENTTDARVQENVATQNIPTAEAVRAHHAAIGSEVTRRSEGVEHTKAEDNTTDELIPKGDGFMNRCVPLKDADLNGNASLAQSAMLDSSTETATAPKLPHLANYPNFFVAERSTRGGKRHCVMCGQVRPYTTQKHANGMPFISRQRKRVCSVCAVQVWCVVESNLKIKWCSQCTSFVPLAAFGARRNLATCECCLAARSRRNEREIQSSTKLQVGEEQRSGPGTDTPAVPSDNEEGKQGEGGRGGVASELP